MSKERESYTPVCVTVVWDDAMNPDLRLMKAISSLIDLSCGTMTDEEVDAALAYMVARRKKPEPSNASR